MEGRDTHMHATRMPIHTRLGDVVAQAHARTHTHTDDIPAGSSSMLSEAVGGCDACSQDVGVSAEVKGRGGGGE